MVKCGTPEELCTRKVLALGRRASSHLLRGAAGRCAAEAWTSERLWLSLTSSKRKRRQEKRKEELEGRQESRKGGREEGALVRDTLRPQLLSVALDA